MAGLLASLESVVTRHPKLFGGAVIFGVGTSMAQLALASVAPGALSHAYEFLGTGLGMTEANASVLAFLAPTAAGLALTTSGGLIVMANNVRRWITGESANLDNDLILDGAEIPQGRPRSNEQRDFATYRGADLAQTRKVSIPAPGLATIDKAEDERFQS